MLGSRPPVSDGVCFPFLHRKYHFLLGLALTAVAIALFALRLATVRPVHSEVFPGSASDAHMPADADDEVRIVFQRGWEATGRKSPAGRYRALAALQAEWGESDTDWAKVAERDPGWLDRQPVFCLNSPSGAIDVFRTVTGLSDWAVSRAGASRDTTASGTVYWGLSDEDMLRCQLALEEPYRKPQRIATLRRVLQEGSRGDNA